MNGSFSAKKGLLGPFERNFRGPTFAPYLKMVSKLWIMFLARLILTLLFVSFCPQAGEASGDVCRSRLSQLSLEHVQMQAWLRKRLSHFSAVHKIKQDVLTKQLADDLKSLWFKKIQTRDQEVSDLMKEYEISRGEAHRLWNLQVDEESYGLFLGSFGERARLTNQAAVENQIRNAAAFREARRSGSAVVQTYSVDASEIQKMIPRFRLYEAYVSDFLTTLSNKGPFSPEITVLHNHQKTTGWYANRMTGWTHFHAHLKRGNPTMVVGFWVKDKDSHQVIVDYWGTHEGVPWGNH